MNWIIKDDDLYEINHILIYLVYTKLYNNIDDKISIGPVNRSGGKMQNSIKYLMEGKIWLVFCFFS